MAETHDTPEVGFEQGVLTLTGDFVTGTVGRVERRFRELDGIDIATIDGSGVTRLDTAGALLVNGMRSEGTELEGFSGEAERVLEISEPVEPAEEEEAGEREGWSLERFGGLVLREVDRITEIAVLLTDILYWSAIGLFDRSQYRKDSFTVQAFSMGSSALPIVGTILFLVGAISALQSTATFRSFGASVFVADMIAIGLAREMAPLMTAIIISGRSGSAIASEIATMKFTEELDAIKTMALNPLRFVVVPKLWAMVVCMPLLSVMALGFGILGGLVVAVTYIDLPATTYFSRITMTLMFWDIVTGLIKSVSFAIIITVVGVYKGLTFSGGADGVGRATTAAVVASIFAIIVMDSIWGIVFYFEF